MQMRMNASVNAYLANAGFSAASLEKHVRQARIFHNAFLVRSRAGDRGLHLTHRPDWAEKYIRRSASVPQAVLDKLGSNSFSKRRPEHALPFLQYVKRQYEAKAALAFRLVVGPVKNVLLAGDCQAPDFAEYLMFVQLARLMEAIAGIYPHGIRVQMIPDDLRGRIANGWPARYGSDYITGLARMNDELQFGGWLQVESGQARLYELYDVESHVEAAKAEVVSSPDYPKQLAAACIKAQQNLVACDPSQCTESAVCESAKRYLVRHRAEMLSGMWSPTDAFPLVCANHPGNYQLFTMAGGLTKLPWQVVLPFSALDPDGTVPDYKPAEPFGWPGDAHAASGYLNA